MKNLVFIFCLFISTIALGQQPAKKIEIKHLTKNYYVCISYGYPDGDEPYPANNLFVVTDKGVIMVDTPWGEEQTRQLVDSLKQRFNKKVIFCIATHFHDDCVGGFNILKKQGAKTFTSRQTYELAKKENNELPQYTFARDTTFNIAGVTLKTYYPGAGHTRDNIVVWLPQQQVLFGGCLVKSLVATTKGFTGDADLMQWPLSIKNVALKYKNARYLIPGHLGWQGGIKQLNRTLQILGRE